MSHKTVFVKKEEPFDQSPNSIVVGEQTLTTNFAPSAESHLTNPPTPNSTSAANNLARFPLQTEKGNPTSPLKHRSPRSSCKSIKIRPHPIIASTSNVNIQARAFPTAFNVQSVPCKLRVKTPPNHNIQPRPRATNGNLHSVVHPPSSAHNNLNEFADLACEVARVQQTTVNPSPRLQQAFPNPRPCMQQTRPSVPPPPPLTTCPYPPPPLLSFPPAPHSAAPPPLAVLGKRPYVAMRPNEAPQLNTVRTHQFGDISQHRAMAQAVAERSLRTMAVAAGCQAARDAATYAVGMRIEADSAAVRARVERLLHMTGDNMVLRSGLEGVLGEVELMKEKVVREFGNLYYEVGELREGLRGVQEMLGMRSRRNEYWRRGSVDMSAGLGVDIGAEERIELERRGVGSPGGGIGSDVSGGAVAVGIDEAEGEGDEETRTKRRKTRSNGVGKRRRDNWTAAENDDFLRLVHENEGMDEMELRRMLAKHFAPRRTHEQCANHLRILRAQNKVPPAVGEAIVYPRRSEQ